MCEKTIITELECISNDYANRIAKYINQSDSYLLKLHQLISNLQEETEKNV